MARQIEFKPLVPELLVRDFARSQAFYCGLLGFERLYGRENPFGRGLNLQIDARDIDSPAARLKAAEWPLFKQPEEVWYRADDRLFGQRQFLAQDPDGYLPRFCRELGERAADDPPADGRIVS